ncbi:MAG: hypothetical protein K8I27_15440 [Planctomycetes bacterium]|nr:hypothetical protein [Planctomycetota bacterium]
MHKLIPGVLAFSLIAGCGVSQGRDNPSRVLPVTQAQVDHEERLHGMHGGDGLELATLWHTGDVKAARGDYSGKAQGLQGNEFYEVEIAENPLRPTVLTSVGYVRLLKEDRGELFIYEFYDHSWQPVAYLGADGSLYRHKGGKEVYLGKYQLDEAVIALFPAPSGYGYDSVLQDDKLVKTWDADVNSAEPRARGVSHRTHTSAPPIIIYTRKRAGEASLLAQRYTRERTGERDAELLARLREERHGGYGVDEEYGGLRYKDGNPVDEDDRPLRPGSIPD